MAGRRAAIVSGGTYGIGRAITLELARRGWPVVAFGLETEQPGSRARAGIAETRAAIAALGGDGVVLEADVSRADDVGRVVDLALSHAGGVGGVVNNAAVRPTGDVLATDEATFARTIAVNLTGPFLLCRAAIPHLRRGGGAIVNVGSRAAAGRRDLAAYAASKGGLHALTRALARDLAGDDVRTSLVIPRSRTTSGMVEAIDGPSRGAWTAPQQEVADAVAFLLSDAARHLNGATLDLTSAAAAAALLPDPGTSGSG